jgi:hypothetical protein
LSEALKPRYVLGISAAEIITELRFRASLPLDARQTDEIPVHLRRLVALRDQHCQ